MGARTRLEPGDRIGDYRIVGATRRGPLWDELVATHLLLPREVLVRVPAEPAQPATDIRLLREACIVEALAHPGVPRLYDCGRLPDRRPWIAQERVTGESLAEAIGDGPLPVARVAPLLCHVAAILDHAHRRGIVHHRVRPETIAFTDGERGWPVCLLDWSEARPHDSVRVPRLGVPHAAPEVERGEACDGRVDVFALAVVAFEALSGAQLFAGAAPPTLVAEWVARELEAGDPASAGVQLAGLIDDMLALDPARRPTAADVVAGAAAIIAMLDLEPGDDEVAELVASAASSREEASVLTRLGLARATTERDAVAVATALEAEAEEAAAAVAVGVNEDSQSDSAAATGVNEDSQSESAAAIGVGVDPEPAAAVVAESAAAAEAAAAAEDAAAALGGVVAKLRAPRWTPPYPGNVPDPRDGEIVSGEIAPGPRPPRR